MAKVKPLTEVEKPAAKGNFGPRERNAKNVKSALEWRTPNSIRQLFAEKPRPNYWEMGELLYICLVGSIDGVAVQQNMAKKRARHPFTGSDVIRVFNARN